jgi:hypothetical protein
MSVLRLRLRSRPVRFSEIRDIYRVVATLPSNQIISRAVSPNFVGSSRSNILNTRFQPDLLQFRKSIFALITLPSRYQFSIAAALGLVLGASAHGEVIAAYSFTEAVSGATGQFPDEAGNTKVIVSPLSAATIPGAVFETHLTATNSSSPAYVFDGKAWRAPANLLTNGSSSSNPPPHFLEFSVQVAAGCTMTLASLVIDFGIDNNNPGTGDTTAQYDLYASVNGGMSYSRLGSTSIATAAANGHVWRNDVVKNLQTSSGSPFVSGGQPVVFSSSSTVSFRLAFSDSNSSTATKAVMVDDIKLNGAITCQEQEIHPPDRISAFSDAFIRSGSPTSNVNSSTTMELAARNGPHNRKVYLGFDLSDSLPASLEASNARLSLAFPPGDARRIGSESGMVELRLYGIADNNDYWLESEITWNSAPHNDIESGTNVSPGAVLLGTVRLDASRVGSLERVTWSSHELSQFINWAVGRRGDRYVAGQVVDLDRKVTFIVTVGNVGTLVPGFTFLRRSAGSAVAPLLEFDRLPPDASASAIQNDRYGVQLNSDQTVTVTEKASGAQAVFAPRFQVLSQTSSPGYSLTGLSGTPQGGTTTQLNYKVPDWTGAGGDFSKAPGSLATLNASSSVASYNGISWTFPAGNGFTFQASLELPPGDAEPMIRWTLTPTVLRYYSVGYTGAPAEAFSNVDSIFQPMIWSGKRIPSKMYLTDESRCSLPVSLVEKAGVVTGIAVDPDALSFRLSTTSNARFAIALKNADDQAQPAVYAPLYGGSGSNRSTPHSFSVRLVVQKGNIAQVFRQLATGTYQFHDQRQNLPEGSLNNTLDNLTDFILNTTGKNYSYWSAAAKANDYVNDQPGYARFQSAVTTLGLALLRDDPVIYTERAVPTIEYFASRRNNLFKIQGYDANYPMGGPVRNIIGDWPTLGAQTGGRFRAWEPLGITAAGVTVPILDRVDHTATYSRETALDLGKRWIRHLTSYYRSTGDPAYLIDAKAIADQYINWRIDQPPSDFRDVLSSFWTEVAPIWDALFELYEVTGESKYRDAAVSALDEFITTMQFGPTTPPGTISVDGNSIPAWHVSEVGLLSEAAGTSDSHRAILMPYVAPYLARAARLTGDPFYAQLAKANIIGRYLNYPGYTVRGSYTTAIQKANYPLRFYSSYVNTAHMNHPLPMAAMIADYLIADAERGSEGKIHFPSIFSDTGAYFRQRLYGHEAGSFYGDRGVWPWLPRGLVTFSGTNAEQINYISGRGNGRIYLSLSNQSPRDTTVTLQLDPSRVVWTTGARVRVWRGAAAQPDLSLGAGSLTVTVPGDGFVALAIDGVTPQLELQSDSPPSSSGRLPASSFFDGTAAFGSNVGMIFSHSPDRQNAFVYTDALSAAVSSMTLRYAIDQLPEQTLLKTGYPFEFSVPLPSTAVTFTYTLEANTGEITTPVVLSLATSDPPMEPVNFAAESSSENSVVLSWDPVPGADGYQIERRLAGSPAFLMIPNLPGILGQWNDTGLLGNTGYEYRIRSFAESGYSSWSAVTSVRTDTPYEAWVREYFGDREGSPMTASTADPDGDQIPNLVEYAMGTAPTVADSPISWAGRSLHFRQVLRPDVASQLWASEDLKDWTLAAASAPGQWFTLKIPGYDLQASGGEERDFVLTPPAASSRLFFRFHAERTEQSD